MSVGPAAEASPGADVVDASGCVVMPGLVDTHRHTWQSALRHIGLVRTVVCDGVVVKRDGVLAGPVGRAMDAAAASLAHLREAVPGALCA
ncbi:hypothetical protein [Microbispora sp. CA-102843]|uniref:hypothetical protein n=1 Tax=Microbispora sp. CA-102843 TaxID=3239952 RepID=UPI003D8BABBF